MGTGGGLVVIDFSEHGNSAHFRREGWSGQEPELVWGIGPRSRLVIPLQASGRAVIMEAELAPALPSPLVTGQLVRIEVNGVAMGFTRIERRTMIRCEINPTLVARRDGLDVTFGFPGFCRPAVLAPTGDDRPLSGCFSFVRVYTTDMYKPGPWFAPSHPDIPVVGLSPPFEPPASNTGAAAVYRFQRDGNAVEFLGDGWNAPEADIVWTEGEASELELPAPGIPGCYVLRVDATPLTAPDRLPRQSVNVLLDGIVIGQCALDKTSAWIVPLPRELTEGRQTLPLTFVLPNASRPTDLDLSPDVRVLGLAMTRIAVLPLPVHLSADGLRAEEARLPAPVAVADRFLVYDEEALPAAISAVLGRDIDSLLRGFESLGCNREFGIVQRKLGLDVLNLFRFCEASPLDLIRALTDDLSELAKPELVCVERAAAELDLVLPGYNLRWPGFDSAADRRTLCREHAVTLGYLRRKFHEGLRGGGKIYVLKHRDPLPSAHAAVLLMELNRMGRATVLCIEEAIDDRRPGEVEWLMPGLMRGYVGRFASAMDERSARPDDWLRVLANAALLDGDFGAIAA